MTSRIKRVGVLTGGGDAPGLNPAIKRYYDTERYHMKNLGMNL